MKFYYATEKDPNSLGTGVNLSPAQREDKEVRRLVRPSPKNRNVRRDVRRELIKDPSSTDTKEVISSKSEFSLIFDGVDDYNGDPWKLAQKCGVRPSSIHDFLCGHTNSDSNIISALFIGTSADVMSFDIVVDPQYRRLGLASDLVKVAISEYEQNLDVIPDLKLQADAVNPNMQKILVDNGFKVIGPSHSGYNMERLSSLLRSILR